MSKELCVTSVSVFIDVLFISVCLVLQESPIHKFLFWVAISVLQLDEVSLYAAGLALIEQNLHTLDNMGLFDKVVCIVVDKIKTNSLLTCHSVMAQYENTKPT